MMIQLDTLTDEDYAIKFASDERYKMMAIGEDCDYQYDIAVRTRRALLGSDTCVAMVCADIIATHDCGDEMDYWMVY